MGARGLGLQAPKMWRKNRPFCTQCSPLYISHTLIFRPIGTIVLLSGRPHLAFCDASSRSRFVPMVFAKKVTFPPISRLFSRGNARFVYHLVGPVEGHATSHRDPNFRFRRFSLDTDPRFWGIGVKALLFDSEHAECYVCCCQRYSVNLSLIHI